MHAKSAVVNSSADCSKLNQVSDQMSQGGQQLDGQPGTRDIAQKIKWTRTVGSYECATDWNIDMPHAKSK